ncbi:relaxase/mobilization nuclease domain-containing protein [Sphingomonas sp. SAFR-052]|uniref:relaxase/mobilization nuclease domain-containing protein n=1 Tax=Sphingomonas sp. SAFR-052 TaxID=3436867 RepID=UPI003F7ED101
MIVKRIPARPAGRNATTERARHARNLVDYLRQPEKQSEEKDYQVAYMLREKLGGTKGERLFHIGGRNFVSTAIEGQRAEMIAVAQAATRSPNPIDHWLLSWREGELPTPGEIDEAVGMFLGHLGVSDQPCIYACHGDTDNRHVHIALNRYDPLARRMIEINDGFTLEAAHQAVALIVDRFGWQAEADARYTVVDGRLVMAPGAAARQEEGRKPLGIKAAAFENRTGYRSAQRIAQEEAVPLIGAARSWDELHRSLAEAGISYDTIGTNGVILSVGNEKVRASDVDRSITRVPLEKRLGDFVPRAAAVKIAARDVKGERLAKAFRADEYRGELERWKRWQKAKRDAASSEHTTDRARAAALAKQKAPKRPAPNLESWYYERGEGPFAEAWRHRHSARAFPSFGVGSGKRPADLLSIDGFRAYPCSDGVRYARKADGPTAFLDRGEAIDVIARDEAAMLAAFRLAVQKSDGRVIVTGDPEFRERTYAMAVRHGLADALADPDLAQRWRALQPSLPQPDDVLAEQLAPPPAAVVGPSLSPLPPALPVQGAKDDVPESSVEAVATASPSANVIKRPIPPAKSPTVPEPGPHAKVPHHALVGRATPPPVAAVGPSPSLAPTAGQVEGAKNNMPASLGQTVPAASPSVNVIKRPMPVAKATAMPEPVPHAKVLSLASTEPDLALPVVDQRKRRKARDANPPRLSKGPNDIDFPPGFPPRGREAGR